MRTLLRAVVLSSLVVAGCARTYQPVIDTRGVHPAQYQADLAQCRQYAAQVSPAANAAGGAVGGGLIGGLIGAALGSISGNAGRGAGYGAIWGSASGGISGGSRAASDQVEIINNCLDHRGYAVLRR